MKNIVYHTEIMNKDTLFVIHITYIRATGKNIVNKHTLYKSYYIL